MDPEGSHLQSLPTHWHKIDVDVIAQLHNRGRGVFHRPYMGIAGIVDFLTCEACFICEQDTVCKVCLEYGLVQIQITEVHSGWIVNWCKSMNTLKVVRTQQHFLQNSPDCYVTHVKVPCDISSTHWRIILYVLQHGFLGLRCLHKTPPRPWPSTRRCTVPDWHSLRRMLENVVWWGIQRFGYLFR